MTDLLATTLALAVPIWIDRIQRERWPWDRIQARARECAQIVAEKGDVILYRGKKRGETARAFNALAEGIALASFVPGGIKTFGMHFEAQLQDEPVLDTVVRALAEASEARLRERSRARRKRLRRKK